MISVVQELEIKTNAYWRLSQIWNGQLDRHLTTGEAIEACTDILSLTSSVRPLSYSVGNLLGEIVKGGDSLRPKETKVLILPFVNRGAK